jgi:hypothetical protein
MLETCQQHQADFLLLYLPSGGELIDPDYPSPIGDFIDRVIDSNNMGGLNPRNAFLDAATFMLTKDSMISLRGQGVPEEEIVQELKSLKHQAFSQEQEFWTQVEAAIGQEDAAKYRQQIWDSIIWSYSSGHYQKPGATVLARAVQRKIATLPAYIESCQQARTIQE